MFLASCIPRYFILFVAIMNGSSFLIWLSLSLLLVYRNACDYCILILYSETLLKLLNSSGVFGLRRWGLLDILACHLQIETICLPPFLFEYPLFFFSCLIALARTSSTVLSRSGERRHPLLVPDFKGNASSFCPFSMILAVGFS